jgi:hypothetical protein
LSGVASVDGALGLSRSGTVVGSVAVIGVKADTVTLIISCWISVVLVVVTVVISVLSSLSITVSGTLSRSQVFCVGVSLSFSVFGLSLISRRASFGACRIIRGLKTWVRGGATAAVTTCSDHAQKGRAADNYFKCFFHKLLLMDIK